MGKWRVMLQGRGCWLGLEEGRGRRRRIALVPHGFYATRFVEAPSATEAVDRAVEVVSEEMEELLQNRPDQPYSLAVEDVEEDPSIPAEMMPGIGFTWYSQQDDPDAEPAVREMRIVRRKR